MFNVVSYPITMCHVKPFLAGKSHKHIVVTISVLLPACAHVSTLPLSGGEGAVVSLGRGQQISVVGVGSVTGSQCCPYPSRRAMLNPFLWRASSTNLSWLPRRDNCHCALTLRSLACQWVAKRRSASVMGGGNRWWSWTTSQVCRMCECALRVWRVVGR